MRVLVTGAAGMVGSHVAELLEGRGHEVIGVDNFATGRNEHWAHLQKTRKYVDSISSLEFLERLGKEVGSIDAIVHAAASFANGNDWNEHILTNTLGTAQLTAMAKAQSARLIYFQTALCYGNNPSIQPVPLDYPRQPLPSSYAISKTAGEFYIEQSGVEFVTFRLANIVGPRNLSGPLPIFFKRLSAGEKCVIADAKRDFVDVRDLAEVVLQAVEGRGNGAYHFSSGGDVSILDLFHQVVEEMEISQPPSYEFIQGNTSGPASILLDPSRTLEDFDVPVLRNIRETVAGAIAYYREFGVSREVTHLRRT